MATPPIAYTIAGATDEYHKIFFQDGSFTDQDTVALSLIQIPLWRPLWFNTISGKNKHAEEHFIDHANKELKKMSRFLLDHKEITIVMMISKSPCFKCRRQLEDFFEKLTVLRKVGINFLLRIANLYHGDDGRKEIIIYELTRWLQYIKNEGLVCSVAIEPIIVTEELSNYTPRGIIEPPRSLVEEQRLRKWDEAKRDRTKKDEQIKGIVNKIEQGVQSPFLYYKTLADYRTLDVSYKRLFYESEPTPPKISTVVGFSQMELIATKKRGGVESHVCEPIRFNFTGCCAVSEKIFNMITQQKEKLFRRWTLREINLTLMFTHCPCRQCLYNILEYLILAHVDKIHLTVHIANFCDEEPTISDMAMWMVELEEKNIPIQLEEILVMTQIPTVYKPKDKCKLEWYQIKKERRSYDSDIKTIVSEIYSEKHTIQHPPEDDQDINELTAQMTTFGLSY